MPARAWPGVVDATIEQWTAVNTAVAALGDADFVLPTRLPGWRVAELVTHLANCAEIVPGWLERPTPARAESSAAQYLLGSAPSAAAIDARDRAQAADATPAQARQRLAAAVAALTPALADVDLARPVAGKLGALRLDELLVTRCAEGVLHGLDLPAQVEPAPSALRVTVRVLLDALATKAPGKAVEVRVPPYGAVQCIEGVRHTRGTPPNVVETDPITWVELAAGRRVWRDVADAGRLRASGERSDLSAYLPVFA